MTRIRLNDILYSGSQYSRLSPDQCQRLHNASLEILARTGARLYDQEAIDLLIKAGAHVSEGNRLRIPAGLVEKAFSTVPKRVALYDRNGRSPIFLEEGNCHYGTGSDCQDVVDGITVCDALPHVDFVMSMFLPMDVNPMVSDRYQMEVMLNHTTKPIVYVTNEFSGCVDAVEMAEVVAGGAEALKLKPWVACYINVTTGLRHNEEALQKLLFLADKGLPAIYVPVVVSSISGPITTAGSVALVNAGMLVGLVLSQLKREGAPFIVPGWGAEGMDMKTMVNPYCAPDPRGIHHALGHHYNLPIFGLGGCSESKLVDQQAAAEAALTLMIETLGGAVAPVEISDETLALDLIDEIGPDGQFLESDHTMAHFRERWYPGVFERGNYDQWQAKGGKSLGERAAEQVRQILAEHEPEPLPEEVAQKLKEIIRRAEAHFEAS